MLIFIYSSVPVHMPTTHKSTYNVTHNTCILNHLQLMLILCTVSAEMRIFQIILEIFILTLTYFYKCDVIVQTDCGPVNGLIKDGAYSFRGIPYATPPIGNLRWKPPLALSPKAGNCWRGTYQAQTYGSMCFQISPEDPSRKTLTGSEDCLYLNVLSPDLKPATLKPVMVWIHGGSLQVSSGSWPLYMPTEELANETDVVYVGFNYRLHAFGFMALQMLADQSPTKTSGNYGFMDMIAVLNWVQANIKHFGGDPNQVCF